MKQVDLVKGTNYLQAQDPGQLFNAGVALETIPQAVSAAMVVDRQSPLVLSQTISGYFQLRGAGTLTRAVAKQAVLFDLSTVLRVPIRSMAVMGAFGVGQAPSTAGPLVVYLALEAATKTVRLLNNEGLAANMKLCVDMTIYSQ